MNNFSLMLFFFVGRWLKFLSKKPDKAGQQKFTVVLVGETFLSGRIKPFNAFIA